MAMFRRSRRPPTSFTQCPQLINVDRAVLCADPARPLRRSWTYGAGMTLVCGFYAVPQLQDRRRWPPSLGRSSTMPEEPGGPPLKVLRKRLNGVYRADGFSGPTRRYVLIV